MTIRRRRGFTLIELLVVIAIIAILAAMLFPVFARARESARKIQCLSNVKNIAMAVQLYLTDYNGVWGVYEHRPEVRAYYDEKGGREDCGHGRFFANPYLRGPVLLDEYTKNRDVWSCPSAKIQMGATVINGCVPDWFTWRKAADEADVAGSCNPQFPKGWGGSITDTLIQGKQATDIAGTEAAQGAFVESIAITNHYERKESTVGNPSRYAVCADGGNMIDELYAVGIAYPDICNLECGNEVCGWVDWVNCTSNVSCGLYNKAPKDGSLLRDPEKRKPYSRHMNGTNIGFRDGHAEWMRSELIIDEAEADKFENIDVIDGPRSYCEFGEEYPGVPTIR